MGWLTGGEGVTWGLTFGKKIGLRVVVSGRLGTKGRFWGKRSGRCVVPPCTIIPVPTSTSSASRFFGSPSVAAGQKDAWIAIYKCRQINREKVKGKMTAQRNRKE